MYIIGEDEDEGRKKSVLGRKSSSCKAIIHLPLDPPLQAHNLQLSVINLDRFSSGSLSRWLLVNCPKVRLKDGMG